MSGGKLDTDAIVHALSIPDAPVRRKGIETATLYLSRKCRKRWQDIYSYLEAMDLSKPVHRRKIAKDTVLIGYRNRKRLYGEFYTVAGTSPRDVGIITAGRAFTQYRVRRSVEALESRASSFKHIARGSGGAKQYIIPLPAAKASLEILRVGQLDHQ